ncbi:MAG: leucine-rich repeat domain-containing protein [Promethearchaeota archaeon]
MKTEEEDILATIKRILNRYHEIDSEGIGPWSEVSEVMEQDREAKRYLNGISVSKLQVRLTEAIEQEKKPLKFIEFLMNGYRPTWVVQPNKFFNSIIECEEVRDSISNAIPKIGEHIKNLEQPENILEFLIQINTNNREYDLVMEIVRNLITKGRKVSSFLISHKIVLNKKEGAVIYEIEKGTKRIPYLGENLKTKVKKKTTFALNSSSRIKYGYIVEDGRIVGLGVNDTELESIPDSIGELSELKLLYLNGNKLKALPESIGNLTKLEGLYLESNKLRKLPKSIGQLSNLQEIYIRSNNLKSLPDEMGNLLNLHRIMLNDNPLTALPHTFHQLENLKDLYIQNTKISLKDIEPLLQLKKLGLKFVYSCLAGNLLNDGKQKEAADTYERLLDLDPDYSGKAIYNLGNILNSQGKYKKAEHYLKNAKNLKSFKIDALISLGYTYFFQNKLEAAAETFQLAFESDKKGKRGNLILLNLGAVYINQNKLDLAEETLLKGLKIKQDDGELCYNLACLYAKKNELKKSLKYLELAIEFGATLLSGIDQDHDFDNLRTNKEFLELVNQYKKKG